MNFSVIRGADKPWGRVFARILATNKRHLILIGAREAALETLTREIVQKHRILVHYLVADDADTGSIISVCEKINDRFEVDLLVNHVETGFPLPLEDYDIRSLDRKLKTNHASGILYLHQLLPNLLLHAHARVIDLWCYSHPVPGWEQALLAFNMRFAEHFNEELSESGLQISSFGLPVFAGAESVGRAGEILENVLPELGESRVTVG
ncbi:SDR family NAD(P)-dependent oxidoreductase [Dyadobacter sp. CY261]|uniref:SDR family NAD(P)-dependent oxidoreductase n=1 Tax=Dyadobacter sp. CY261 TaxID=2907203 RepID=UPI001F33A4E1|nr:SDR family NAD(P)-dependent oxidoreductase [Dyadobacter sp. CY261]MCF0071257.1 SDR family NAD(P)-dependent oxidoreductase [Dyadobacter sp. CY261]